jgi:hypothetical protein
MRTNRFEVDFREASEGRSHGGTDR